MSRYQRDDRTREGPAVGSEGETERARATRPSAEYTGGACAGDVPTDVETLVTAARRMTERAGSTTSPYLRSLCAMKVAEARALVLVMTAAEHRARYRDVRSDA